MDDVRLRRGSAADIDRLEDLWIGLHRRHQESMPELAPYVGDAASWTARRALYAELLAKPDTVLLLAWRGARLVGYGLAHVMPRDETWVADTWVSGDRVGEIESVGVVPELRGRGLGTRLLDALEQALREDGVHDLVVGALPGNTGAVRLYERRGFRPAWLYLMRLDAATGGRDAR
jgi:ribosomal protein S18 acetylase RimI-like enzyme